MPLRFNCLFFVIASISCCIMLSSSSDKTLSVVVCLAMPCASCTHMSISKQFARPYLSCLPRTFCELCLTYIREKGTCENEQTSEYISPPTHCWECCNAIDAVSCQNRLEIQLKPKSGALHLARGIGAFLTLRCCISGCFSRILGPKVDWSTGVYRGCEIGTTRKVLNVSLAALLCIHVSACLLTVWLSVEHMLPLVWCGGAYIACQLRDEL